jgi:4'-phosphopantetheinyl transferase
MPQRQIAFFHYWTGKEAYIKAVGSGVFRLAKQVEVAIAPETTQLVSIAGDPDIAKHWTLQAFTPAPGYAGALAIKGKLCTLKFWEFSGVA